MGHGLSTRKRVNNEIENKCKNCKHFTKINKTHGDCNAIIFDIQFAHEGYDETSDIVLDSQYDENVFTNILVSQEFGCLKFQY